MRIHLHISLAGVPARKSKAAIQVPDGSTVSQVLSGYAAKHGLAFFQDMRGVALLVNHAPAKANTELQDGDILRVFRPSAGG